MARRGSTTVQIIGLENLERRLAELGPQMKEAAAKAVKETAEMTKDGTRQNVRVDSGNLRDSVDIKYLDDGLQAEVGWRDRDDRYASIHEFGSRRIPAKPALGPALERERTQFAARVRTELRKVLE